MKQIQIFALAAALAVTATAQNTNSANQNSGATAQPQATDAQKKKPAAGKDTKSSGDTSKIQVTVPKDAGKTAAKGATPVTQKPAAATPQKSQPIVVTPAAKQSGASTAAKGAAAPAPAKSGAASKTPVVAVVPPAKADSSQKNAAKSGPFGARPATAATKTKPAVVAVKPATPKKSVVAKPVVAKKVEPKTAAKPAAGIKTVTAAGRRDPFVSVVRNVTVGQGGPNCFTGKKCLYIPELVVQGTVKDNSTGEMMAVVVNRIHNTYFLRESDQVFNGAVEKITSDSVIFREFATDNLGRSSAHEVVKRVGPVS